MSSESSTGPSTEELADARRSGQLAATKKFPPGVCRHPAGSVLAQVWMQAYTDAQPAEQGDAQ
ncbi:hypothetical protein [Streptosporangium sp. NPDC048865]|uniref:hypothetical protein n=1 Tax=Streptosporangium sp. NPDC048865 TaxID=3155766 RepID=UPI0034143381